MKKVDVIIGGQYVPLPLESRTNRTSAVYTTDNAFCQVNCSCDREHILHPGQSIKCRDTDITYKLERKTYGIASKQKYFARAIVPLQNEPKEERRRRDIYFGKKPAPEFTHRDLEAELYASVEVENMREDVRVFTHEADVVEAPKYALTETEQLNEELPLEDEVLTE